MKNEFGYIDDRPFKECNTDKQIFSTITIDDEGLEFKINGVSKFGLFDYEEMPEVIYAVDNKLTAITALRINITNSNFSAISSSIIKSDLYFIKQGFLKENEQINHFKMQTKIRELCYYNNSIRRIFFNDSIESKYKLKDNSLQYSCEKRKNVVKYTHQKEKRKEQKMKLEEFDYNLPEELIAQVPIQKRDESRLMVVDRKKRTIEDKVFRDIIDYLEPGDCLVRNNTKVIPARLYGKKDTGANVEFVLLKQLEGDVWESIVRPGNKLKPGSKVIFGDGLLNAEILEILEDGTRKVKFTYEGIFNEILDKIGLMPLPPYIHESLKENDRYQTVYAKYEGSSAAPTAGLHFTPELLKKIEEKGIKIANVTLHVGIGTFRPVKEENIEEHKMHTEHFYIKQEDVEKINETKKNGKRVIAVGTTSCRVLETIADENTGLVKQIESDTGIYIYPGYKFKCVDGLITNFHLPKSTLLMLVSALADREFILEAYNKAVEEKYRFFSFGDAMFIK